LGLDRAKITRLREGLNLSMAAAAKLAKMKSAQQWHGVESGSRKNPSIDTVERVAKALGVTVNDLLR
jgi:transcriptional regulator with XRE-family HTH domain